MSRTKLILLVVIGIFVILQLVPVNQTNPIIVHNAAAAAEANNILRTSCYDCHSNETVWPWYSRIAPGSFLITRDVIVGRQYLNFSEFSGLNALDSTNIADAIIEVLEAEKMPILPYLLLHPSSSLSDSQVKVLINWAETLYPK